MRTIYKIAVPFLIWPLSIAAQDRSASVQPDSPQQGSTGTQNFMTGSDMANMATPASSDPVRIPVVVTSAPAFLYVQPTRPTPAAIAGNAPSVNISAGYSVTSLGLPAAGRAALSGANISLSTDTGRRYGAQVDLGYQRAPNVYSSGQPVTMISYLLGPVFYPFSNNLVSTYGHALIGGARVSGPFPNGSGGLNVGYAHFPAWALGGGVEYRLSRAFGFRIGVDYLHTHFYNATGAVRGQNGIRVVSSLVYYIGSPLRGE